MAARNFTLDEVAKHNTEADCWVVIHGKVFNVTSFLAEHPGGKKVILKEAGKDATSKFDAFHKPDVLLKYGPNLYVGDLASASAAASAPAAPAARTESSSPSRARKAQSEAPPGYGELIPHGDPSWYQEWHSPYYNDSHRRFRAAMRDFVEREMMPYCHEWDEAKRLPRDLYTKAFQAGWLPGVCGRPWQVDLIGSNIAGGVKPEEWDYFHGQILSEEVCRAGSGGVAWALFGGLSIGLPPILKFGSKALRQRVGPACLRGETIICLAITEPSAGSDVANLHTEAKKSPDGRFYVVNGEKKWITNGVFADYFTVAVRTGGAGMGGVSLLLVERGMSGVTTRQMQCSGVWPSGTTYITFEDVHVPVENLIGRENEGFKYIMDNFNSERWGICVQAIRFARVCYEEAFKYAHKRKTFGVRLVDHPVIRNKLAHMARQVEASHGWLENITYQMCKMSHSEATNKLGGPIALLKAQATVTFEFCAREASQIFGGLAYTRGGQGEKVERLYREVRAYSIPGGSEEIMLDLGIRQAMRRTPGAAPML